MGGPEHQKGGPKPSWMGGRPRRHERGAQACGPARASRRDVEQPLYTLIPFSFGSLNNCTYNHLPSSPKRCFLLQLRTFHPSLGKEFINITSASMGFQQAGHKSALGSWTSQAI